MNINEGNAKSLAKKLVDGMVVTNITLQSHDNLKEVKICGYVDDLQTALENKCVTKIVYVAHPYGG